MPSRAARWRASWRVALRTARRDLWHAPARTALAVLLVAVPLAGAGVLEVYLRSSQSVDDLTFQLGDAAQALIQGDSPSWAATEATLRRVLPARDRLVPRTLVPELEVLDSGRLGLLGAQEWDYRDLPGLVDTTAGRAPATAGEAVLANDLARADGVVPGRAVTVRTPGGPERSVTVVGLYRSATDGAMLLFPGTLPPSSLAPNTQAPAIPTAGGVHVGTGRPPPIASRDWFVVGPEPVTRQDLAAVEAAGLTGTSRDGATGSPNPAARDLAANSTQGVVLAVLVGMVLLQIVLMAGPAMAVGARRSEQSLALVAACGGDGRQVRRQVLAGGLLVGLVGGVLGTAVGLAAGAALERHGTFTLSPGHLHVDPVDVLVLIAVGAGTAVAAAALPARQAARTDVVAVLAGRPSRSAPRLRVPLGGVLVALTGAAMAFAAAATGHATPLIVGVAAGEAGLVATSGAVVALAARLARRWPVVARMAVRDAARHRSRTAPAVAAAMAAIAGGTAALLFAATEADLGHRTTITQTAAGVAALQAQTTATGQSIVQDWTAVTTAVRGALPVGAAAPLRSGRSTDDALALYSDSCALGYGMIRAIGAAAPGAVGSVNPCPERTNDPRRWYTLTVGTWVDDGSALDLVVGGADPGAVRALRAGRTVVWDPRLLRPDGTVRLWFAGRVTAVPGWAATGPERLDTVLLSDAAARAVGVPVHQVGLVTSLTRAPSAAEVHRADRAWTAAGRVWLGAGTLEVPDPPGLGAADARDLLVLVGVAGFVALAGVLAAVALAAAEGRADRATLAAVGGAPWLGRRLAAAQALVIAGLGSVLGVLSGGLVGGAVLVLSLRVTASLRQPLRRSLPTPHLVVPWGQLAVLVIGVPLIAALVAAVAARSPSGPLRRRGL
jgi:putative ABC transport system permease protein